jgi:putative phosphoesterase
MKLFVISDIHGSYKYALLAAEAFKKSQADKLVCLGDFYYHGPRNPLPEGYAPMDVSKLLNTLKDRIIAIKGNCDAEVDEYISEFPFVPSYLFAFSNGKKVLFCHGHHEADLSSKPDGVISGHTHISLIKKDNGIIYANPGSISLPKADKSRNFMIVEEDKITIFDLLTEEEINSVSF